MIPAETANPVNNNVGTRSPIISVPSHSAPKVFFNCRLGQSDWGYYEQYIPALNIVGLGSKSDYNFEHLLATMKDQAMNESSSDETTSDEQRDSGRGSGSEEEKSGAGGSGSSEGGGPARGSTKDEEGNASGESGARGSDASKGTCSSGSVGEIRLQRERLAKSTTNIKFLSL